MIETVLEALESSNHYMTGVRITWTIACVVVRMYQREAWYALHVESSV